MKHDAIVEQGIPIHERVPIPEDMIPEDSRVEIDAKIQAGYCKLSCYRFRSRLSSMHPLTHISPAVTTGHVMSMDELANVKGRGWEDIDVRVSNLMSPDPTTTIFLLIF